MLQYSAPAKPDDVLNLPVDQLAVRLLRWFSQSTNGLFTRRTFLTGAENAYDQDGFHNHKQVLRLLGEAFDWLYFAGLLAQQPGQSEGGCYITERGNRVLDSDDGAALLRAERRLDIDLHPSIARKVRSQFLLGEYELAAFSAMREVEIRVRRLAAATDSDVGVRLMRQSFSAKGALFDQTLDGGEQEGLGNLFAGAIGVFKNPSSHRQVEYTDPVVASEVVILGDLLLRLLDGIAERLPGQDGP